MHTINKKEFDQLKENLAAWLEVALNDGETRYHSEGLLHVENENTFDYPINCVMIKISAICNPKNGDVKHSHFDDIEIIDEENNTFKAHQINEEQIKQLNNIIKAI